MQCDSNGLQCRLNGFAIQIGGFATRIPSSKYNVHTICMHTSSIDLLPGPSYIHWYTEAEACSHKYQILGVDQSKLTGRSVMTSSSSLLKAQVKLDRRYQFSLDVLVYESMHVLPPLSQVGAKARLWNLEWTCELDYSTDIQTEFKIDVELV